MTVKRFFANIIVLAVFAAAVFFIGWVQFFVKPRHCAVMQSKTGGIYSKPIVPGSFEWRWERLLPTNVTLTAFSTEPVNSVLTVSGTLPGGETYSSLLEGNPGFSYSMTLQITASVAPEDILELFSDNKISSQKDLDAYIQAAAKAAASSLAEKALKSSTYVSSYSVSPADVSSAMTKAGFGGITVLSASVTEQNIPDMQSYENARSLYAQYSETLSAELAKKAQEQAAIIAEEDRSMQKLEKFAELLKKYPELQEISKSGDITKIMDALGALR